MKDMRRLKRGESAVSPVIATILMVAITVVLAATLWSMVEADQDIAREFFGTLREGDRSRKEGWIRVDIVSMSPSRIDLDDVTVRLYDSGDARVCTLEGGEIENENTEEPYTLRWTRTNDQISSTSRLRIEGLEGHDFSGYELVITADGYNGGLTRKL